MDIRFNCPHCGQHLCVEDKGAGMTVNCPGCNEHIEIPRATAVSPSPQPSPPPPVKRTNPAIPILIGVAILFALVVIGSLMLNNSSSSHHNVQTPSAQDAPFEVELKEGFPVGKFLVCNVSFNGTLPPPETVDKILHDQLQSAALSHPTREILAMAWHGDDALEKNQFSGHLIYKPAERRILRLDESRE